MRAMVYRQYGTPAVLHLEEVERPVPKAGEVLIRVAASSVNSWDWDLVRGKPWMVRLGSGWSRPRQLIIGADVAGVVEAVPPDITVFRAGDAVFGDLSGASWGGFAEYVAAPASVLAAIPEGLDFAEAAALPQAGLLALQAVRLGSGVTTGMAVLINGAGGGAGSFAVQLARNAGAEVTGVDRADKAELMRALGAVRTMDYQREDFVAETKRYDLIIDMVANRPLAAYRRVLAPTGRLVVVGGATATIAAVAFAGLFNRPGGQPVGLLFHRPNVHEIAEMAALVTSGQIRPAIDRIYSLTEAAAAVQRIADGSVLGKVVVRI